MLLVDAIGAAAGGAAGVSSITSYIESSAGDVHPLMYFTISFLIYFGQDVLEPRSRPEAVGPARATGSSGEAGGVRDAGRDRVRSLPASAA